LSRPKGGSNFIDQFFKDLIAKVSFSIFEAISSSNGDTAVPPLLNITGRRSRLSGGGGATCPDFRSHPA